MSAVQPSARGDAAAIFAPGTVVALLLVGLVAFVGLGVLMAFGPELQGGLDGGGNALSRSAVGYAGVARLLRESGRTVSVSRGVPPADGVKPTLGVLIMTPPVGATAAEITKLTAGEARVVLIVAPKWRTVPDPRHPGWAAQVGLAAIPALSAMLHTSAGDAALQQQGQAPAQPALQSIGDFSSLGALETGPVSGLQTGAQPNAESLIVDGQGRPVLSHVRDGVYLLSDPDLIDNLGLADVRTARTAMTLIEVLAGPDGPVDFDVSLNGLGRPRSLLGLALSPPFLGATLCVLAAAVLMGAHAAVRFGPTRGEARAFALGKGALLDNAAMLIGLAKREPAMGRRYAALVRRTLLRRTQVSRALGGRTGEPAADALADAALDRLPSSGAPTFSALIGEAERAHDGSSLMRAARALHQRQMEILGERS